MGFSIGEVSQAIGLAPQTLRLWERERLVGGKLAADHAPGVVLMCGSLCALRLRR